MLKENSREHKLYAGLIVDINGYVDDCEKENMIDNLHELVNILSRVEPPVKPACETLQKRFEIYVKAINQIDDLFEYRYRNYGVERLKKEVINILDNITQQMSKSV